jgi:hypothetical protein
MADDVTLQLGGESQGLVDAVTKGGDAFQQFVAKSVSNAEQLGKKLREVSGTDLIASAEQYAKSISLIGGATKLTADEQTRVLGILQQAKEKYAALGQEGSEAFQQVHQQLSRGVAAHQEVAAEAQRLAAAEKAAAAEAGHLATKVKELNGGDTIKQAQDYAAAVGEIGGASKLTTDEKAKLNSTIGAALEKYKALGIEAPDALKKLHAETTQSQKSTGVLDATLGKLVASFTAAAIIDRGIGLITSWGAAAVKSAGDTLDLSEKIGLSTDTIQEMGHIATVAEVPLEGLAASAQALLVRIERSNPTVREAVERFRELGLSWQELKALSPDDQFNRIIEALERMEDPQERSRMAYDLLGGKADVVLRAIAEGWTDLRNEAVKSSRDQLQAIDDTMMAYNKGIAKAEGWFKSAVGAVFMWGNALKDAAKGVDVAALLRAEMEKGTAAQAKSTEQTKQSIPVQESHVALLKKQAETVAALTTEQRAELLAADKLGKITDDLLDKYNLTTAGLELLKDATQKKTEADKQAADKAKQLAAEEKKRQDELFGRDLITRANQYVKELGGVEHLTKLSKEQTEKLAMAVAAGLAAYERLGEKAPASLAKVGAATAAVLAGFEKAKPISLTDWIDFDKNDPTAPIIAGFEKLKDLGALAFTEINKTFTAAKPVEHWALKMAEGARQLPQLIAQAFLSGGGWEGALIGSASTMGAAAMGTWIGEVGKSGVVKGMTGLAGHVLAAAGPVIGALAGPLTEVLVRAFNKPEHVRIMQDVGRDWGVSISEGLAKQIERDAAELFRGDRVAGSIFNLDKIIAEAGGLSDGNFNKFVNKLRDVFALFESGKFTAAEAAQVIDENWSAFVQHGTDGNGRISASLKEIIALNDRLGVQSKEIAAWQQGQASTAIAGFNAVVAGMVQPWTDLGARIKKAREEVTETTAALRELARDENAGTNARLAAQQKVDEAQRRLLELLGVQQTEARAARQSLEDLGVQAVATFAAAVAAGESFPAALRAAGPGLQGLREAYQALGIETDNVALRTLLLQNAILDGNPRLVDAIDGLNQQMIALDNLNLLNAESFGSLERTAMSLYTRLQSEVHNTADASMTMEEKTRMALIPMQGYLQQAAQQAERLGIPLDANTQLLIDQSRQLGLWEEAGESANDIMLGGFRDVAAAVRELKNFLEGVVTAASNIPTRIDMSVYRHNYTIDHGTTTEGGDVPGHRLGGVFSTPHLARIAEGGKAEIVGDIDFMTRALAGAMQRVGVIESAVAGASSWLSPGSAAAGIYIGSINIPISTESVDRASMRDLVHAIKDGLVEELSGLIAVGVGT